MGSSMLRKSWFVAATAFLLAGSALAGTFGKVVSIGGHASDLALDEPRGVLYVANFTANRIEVMSLQSNTIQTSLNVAAQPSAVPVPPQNFPPNIVASSVAASFDGQYIWGLGDTLQFRYTVATGSISSSLYIASPALAPRTVSVSGDGSFATLGWELRDSSFGNL